MNPHTIMQLALQILFWSSIGFVAYAYFGYPILLWLRCRLRQRPVNKAAIEPFVSIVISLRDEITNVQRKLKLLQELDYPAGRHEIILVSDGSTDGTNQFLAQSSIANLKAIFLPEAKGKAAALNAGVAACTGEIVLLMDARQTIAPDCLRQLVACFADPEVGCASGELVIREEGQAQSDATGLYWRLEKQIRKMESNTGSVIGATGALYAVRRKLIPVLPEGTLVDDVYIPMYVVRAGFRVVFEPAAIAWDTPSASSNHEWRRKVRTLVGNYQLMQLAPWLLTRQNRLRFQFVSHKVCRLFVPFALLLALASCAFIPGIFFRAALACQLLFYGMALIAPFTRWRLARVAFTFVMLNSAAATAFLKFASGRKVAWGR